MWIGWIEFDLLLGDVRSLKQKRGVIRPILAEVRRRYDVSDAETAGHDLYRRASIGAGVVATDAARVIDVLDRIERGVADRPEIELLSARRGLSSSED